MKLNHQLKLWEIPYKLKTTEFFALSISAGVSTFGLHTILNPIISKDYQLFFILFAFLGFFMLIDRLRRGSLAGFFNAELTQLVESYMGGKFKLNGETEVNVTPTRTRWFAGLLGGIFTLVILFADIFGGYSIYEVGKKHLVEYEISTNQGYQKEVLDEKSGKIAEEEYNIRSMAWNDNRERELRLWRVEEAANKSEYNKNKKTAYAQCNRSWSIARNYYTKNAKCKNDWDKANVYHSLAKPPEMMKPVLVASKSEEDAVVIGASINQATARATAWAEPFAKGFFMLYVVLALILNGLVLKSLYLGFTDMLREIHSDPSLYKKAYQHYEIVRRAERHGLSENKEKEETETMNIRVKLSEKTTDLAIKGEKKRAVIKLKQHQLMEEGGYKEIINHLRNKNFDPTADKDFLEAFNDEEYQQPTPKKIEQKEDAAFKEAAKKEDNDKPIGFRVGDEATEQPLAQAKKPTYKHNSYFDDGYDLTVAIYCLFEYGKKEAGMRLLSNKKLKALYDESPFKRSELKENQIPSLVRKPLKEKSLIIGDNGYQDIAQYNLDEVLTELGLLAYAAEITKASA